MANKDQVDSLDMMRQVLRFYRPTPMEIWNEFEEFHRVLIDEPIRWLDPEPGPITAAIESDVLFMDRSQDVDLVTNGNNAQYTATQLVVIARLARSFFNSQKSQKVFDTL